MLAVADVSELDHESGVAGTTCRAIQGVVGFISSLPSKFIPGRTTAGAGVGADANDLYDDWN
jgi:hypothetical protein